NPHIHQVKQIASQMPVQTTVLIGVNNMAELMANSDLAISAAGSTVWELCTLGVPSLLLCTADNQKEVIQALIKENAMLPWGVEHLTQIQKNLTYYSNSAAQITDGRGVERVVSCLR
ncbi:MAG: glycosyltransferase, partial [Venatoribacter sp.]